MKQKCLIGIGAFAMSAGLACTCLAADGPDVIVGDLPDISNWTAGTPVNGIRAYSVGTTSCNVGTVVLQWIASNNRHPVIGQNLYKLSNGRFTQIGQSWLKHGFTALQGTVCSTSCTPNPGGGSGLGLLCSDPYGSSLNGGQSRLGPKSEVNAATGFYPYPFINQGTTGTIGKRLQVNDTELTPEDGSQYFVSGQYVTWDDTQAGNKTNNESYRRATVGAAPNRNITVTGTTQRGIPAIYAWQDHGLGANIPDPGVIITHLQVPEDGDFFVGSKATSVGTNVWRYEYAIQNLTSDRSGGSFSIPLPAGAVVTNVGFHDVDYHSGEPYNNTDWTNTVTADSITWNVVGTYVPNPAPPAPQTADTANALRWGTIYSFWMDVNFPPENGTGTLGLFKPGTPASASVGIRVPSVTGQTGPTNDDFVFAPPVGAGTTPFTTTGASTDGNNLTDGTTIANDVWFRYTAACTGSTTIGLCGSAFDTKMAVYALSAGVPAAGSEIASNNDDPLCPTGNGTQSRVTFNATANATYFIRIGGNGDLSGDAEMSIVGPSCTPQPPANNAIAGAQWLADAVEVTGTTSLATNDGTATCGNSATSPDVWFLYRPQTSGVIFFTTCGSQLNTVLSVYDHASGAQIACNDNAQSGDCAGSNQSLAAIVGTAGTTYRVRLAGANNSRGSYAMKATGGGGVLPAPNDACLNRQVLPFGTTNFNNLGSATDGPTHVGCPVPNDVWYNLHTDTAGDVTITTNATFDSAISVYSGAGCTDLASRLVMCSDTGGSGTNAAVTFAANANSNYTIRVGGTTTGTGTISVTAGVTCVADMDDGTGTGTPDGGVTVDDLLYYVGIFGNGNIGADVDDGSGTGAADGAVTIDDLLYYIVRFQAGC
ncbi:MAG: hypothetical protein IPK69_10645 [Phycisphaerales bacterium]|nr:MAG: hypothetical protein IPK69_10645 [Phycisphaerales bacterium]